MPTAPPTRCTTPGCHQLATRKGRCDAHPSSGWIDRPRPQDRDRSTTRRNQTTASEWQRTRSRVLRDHHNTCHVCGLPGADQVDHIIPIGLGGARKDPANLAPIHAEPCHRNKTAKELTEMRRNATAQQRAMQSEANESETN
ncbi:HNH endonuclease [Arthrobacter sulfonylureivorans]|uniref:HNH endonuclease n=1 Tax=Arthrobacter sulfonylureivorans TaxID=2486855 RepID=UPI003BAF1F94